MIDIDICQCCLLLLANGICCEPDDCGTADRLAQRWPATDWHITLGKTTDECGHDWRDPEDQEAHSEGCEQHGFSWRACEGCGSNLGGDRYAATTWRNVPSEPIDA
jgi:hypothetical protein